MLSHTAARSVFDRQGCLAYQSAELDVLGVFCCDALSTKECLPRMSNCTSVFQERPPNNGRNELGPPHKKSGTLILKLSREPSAVHFSGTMLEY